MKATNDYSLAAMALAAAVLATGCATRASTPLQSSNPLTREEAISQMGATGDMSHYGELVQALRRDPNRMVRSQAAFSIGEISKRYYSIGFYTLVDALENDPSVFVRSASALSLSATHDSRAIAPLVRALNDNGRGRIAVRRGDSVVVYSACVADAARTSLEKIMRMSFTSQADTATVQRHEIALMWEEWYISREHIFPGTRAFARGRQ